VRSQPRNNGHELALGPRSTDDVGAERAVTEDALAGLENEVKLSHMLGSMSAESAGLRELADEHLTVPTHKVRLVRRV
jgi:hypothetical protein